MNKYARDKKGMHTMGASQKPAAKDMDLQTIRSRLLDKGLLYFAYIVPLASILSLARILEHGWNPIHLLHICIAALMITGAIFRKRLSYRVRTCLLLGMFFVIGSAGLLVFGLVGGGLPVLVMFSVLTALAFGTRAGLIACIISLVIIVATGTAVYTATVTFFFDVSDYATSITAWGAILVVFILFVPVTVAALGVLQESLAASLRDLRENARLKNEFVNTVAHELRTPLTAIQGFSELLLTEDQLSQENQKESLRYIYERTMHLTDMVDDMLDIARIESGAAISLKISSCPVADIYKQLEPFFKLLPSRHSLDVNLAEEGTLLNVDRGKMVQVLENLLSNAIKFSGDESTVQIQGRLVDERYQFSVVDHGIGMSPDQVKMVFEKFYRVDASDTAVPGVGLGMSVVRHIVEAHGGSIWVESELDRGTTVYFSIPLTKEIGNS